MERIYFKGLPVPVDEIERNIKDGRFILKSQGNINSDVRAQTIIVYGNVTGPIKADQVVIINGNAIGNVHANTVTKLESKEEKTCKSCKYYQNRDNFFQCKYLNITLIKAPKTMIPCERYTRVE